MNLAEAGGDIGADHHFGLGHRLIGVEAGPGIRAEMVAAQHNARASKPDMLARCRARSSRSRRASCRCTRRPGSPGCRSLRTVPSHRRACSAWRSDASMTMGWAQQIDVMPTAWPRLWRAMRSSKAFMRRLPAARDAQARAPAAVTRPAPAPAQDLQRARHGAGEDQREHRGDQRCARIGQRRNHDGLAMAEGVNQRQRADGIENLDTGGHPRAVPARCSRAG